MRGWRGGSVSRVTRSRPPKYLQIAELLRARIADDESDARLPGLIELAKFYAVSQTTVTMAERVLTQHGVITICQGEAPYTHPDKARIASLGKTLAVPLAGVEQLREIHRSMGELIKAWDRQMPVSTS